MKMKWKIAQCTMYMLKRTYDTRQWAAVATQYWLISDPPQKWNPEPSCEIRGLGQIWQKVYKPSKMYKWGIIYYLLATWSETCQGQDPDTAFSPFTTLLYPLTCGLMEGTPQPYSEYSAKMTSLSQFAHFPPANWYTPGKKNKIKSQKLNVLT